MLNCIFKKIHSTILQVTFVDEHLQYTARENQRQTSNGQTLHQFTHMLSNNNQI